MTEFNTSASYARMLDEQDELAPFRARFVSDDPKLIYLDGNSLGRLPKATAEKLAGVVGGEWGGRLIRGWNEGWFDLPERVGAKLARLIGAWPDEVIMADSTSVNLFKLTLAALRQRPGRTKVVTDDLNFPSDLYVLQGALRLAGPNYRLDVVSSADGIHGPVEELAAAIDQETALVVLSATTFKSGYTYDLAAVTDMAHRAGALALWDVSHSVGVVPLALADAGVDLAVGCTYKYLNGGPGAPALIFIKHDLQERLENPISGWMGQHQPFDFALQYRPAQGIRRFLTGTPPILSLAAVEPGLDILLEAGLDRVRVKSVAQTDYLVALWERLLAPLGFRLNSPRDPAHRGSHISLGHDDGFRIDQALIQEMAVLPDFRHPDNIRLGIAPLYNSFTEIHTAVAHLRTVVIRKRYEQYPRYYDGVT
jgi:kynureninase